MSMEKGGGGEEVGFEDPLKLVKYDESNKQGIHREFI